MNPEDMNSARVHERSSGQSADDAASQLRLPDGVLRDGEVVRGRGRCWAAVQRERVPLLVLARRRYDLVLTDRRLLLLARGRRQRRRLGVGPDGVALQHDLDDLALVRTRNGFPLLQLLVQVPNGRTLVLEFDRVRNQLGRDVAAAITT